MGQKTQAAQETLVNILNKARHLSQDKDRETLILYAKDLQTLLVKFPKLNPNLAATYAEPIKRKKDEWFVEGFPNTKLPKNVSQTEMTYLPCTPLTIAVIYEMGPILDVLLADSRIDVTAGNPYFHAHFLYLEGKSKLRAMHLKQFHDTALTLPFGEHAALCTRHGQGAPEPYELRTYIHDQVMTRVHKASKPEFKIRLVEEALNSLPKNNALASFMGEEVNILKRQFEKNLNTLKETHKPRTMLPLDEHHESLTL